MRAAALVVALACSVGCSDPSGLDGVEVVYALREGFWPFGTSTRDTLAMQTESGRADTLVFRTDGTGERRTVVTWGSPSEPSYLTHRTVTPFEYELRGEEWTLESRLACMPDCDQMPPPPVSLTRRSGVLYLHLFGIEFPYDRVR